jgi:hypothetical protein
MILWIHLGFQIGFTANYEPLAYIANGEFVNDRGSALCHH